MQKKQIFSYVAHVCSVTCEHCQQEQQLHFRAAGASLATPVQEVPCKKCGGVFYVADLPPIYDGPFLPDEGPAPGL